MKKFKKILGHIIGFIFVALVLMVMLAIAYIPTWLIGPEGKTGQTICYFLLLTIFIFEVILFMILLAKTKK